MNMSSLGDLAQSYVTRQRNAEIKQEINTLTDELSSGRISDIASALAGDFGQLASLERSLSSLDAFKVSSDEATFFTDSQQLSLEGMASGLDSAVEAMLAASNSSFPASINSGSIEADSQFRAMVSSLNGTAGGRSLFAGDATGDPALADAQDILDELSTLVTGMTDPDVITATVDDWFNTPGGGYETFAYIGSTEEMQPFLLGDGRTYGPGITALDSGVREALGSLAMGALMMNGVVTNDTFLRGQVMDIATESSLTAKGKLLDTQSVVGTLQNQIETQQARIAAEHSAYSIARTELVAADPYETATRLENVQFQLEALYTSTAYASRMSLLDYI
ncbi:flagellin [Poseidonocella sedimentorum]|uniref:Flagellar hook-associated protein 3 FlgL n=1 Tax=Poseidonocella sedimentorum TaxID=871652 RepID=A0A1I6D5Z0_9RHOB|nr:flagellin [Poseidonocella sedimentorum]SFR00771.1 flagellar hook-associated protein 3 FlgL [Poseidonocella sedimentorum]